MKMKLYRDTPGKKLTLPSALTALAGLSTDDPLEFHAEKGALVITPANMTAMEIIHALEAIQNTWTDLAERLTIACGDCDRCGLCDCTDLFAQVMVPPQVLEEAGLPPDCKLTATVDEEGDILVEAAEYQYDLTDVPEGLLDLLRLRSMCLMELEDLLVRDCPICDEEE